MVMKRTDDPCRVSGPEGLERLKDFTRRLLAVPKSEIAEKLKEPIRPRKRGRRKRKTVR